MIQSGGKKVRKEKKGERMEEEQEGEEEKKGLSYVLFDDPLGFPIFGV